MSVLIGQVYNPRFKQEEKNGATKTSLSFSLATRKAFVDEGEGPNLFTSCVAYSTGLATTLNEYFGKEDHKGKAIVLFGHFNEFDWMPDPANPQHDRYFQEFKITSDVLAQGNVILAEGSAQEVTVLVPMKQTTRQFVVSGFEFADSAQPATRVQATAPTSPVKVVVPGTLKSEASEKQLVTPSGQPVADDESPF